jgi:hypothetical protein
LAVGLAVLEHESDRVALAAGAGLPAYGLSVDAGGGTEQQQEEKRN